VDDLIDDGSIIAIDATGRKLKVKRLSAVQRMKLFRIMGADNSRNDRYVGFAALAASVVEIDGVPVAFPTKLSQLEALVETLGDEGIQASAKAAGSLTPDDE
jgi:hypothetical protein